MSLEYLPLFKRLDALDNGNTVIVGTESCIFDRYPSLVTQASNKKAKTLIIAHCHDEVIMSHGLRKHLANIERDLSTNPQLHIILLAMYDYSKHLPSLPNFHAIYYPEWHGIYWQIYSSIPVPHPFSFTKRFLSLNKRADVYRQLLFYKFYHAGWLKDNIFSYLCESGPDNGTIADPGSFDYMHEAAKHLPLIQDFYSKPPINHVSICDDRLLADYMNPVLDKPFDSWQFDCNADPSWLIERTWYKDTYCSLIIETNASDHYANLSEKIFRAIAMEHIIYLFASPDSAKVLSDLGLNLGPDMNAWQHNRLSRFGHYVRQIESIANLSMDQLMHIKKERYPLLQVQREQYMKINKLMHQRQHDIYQDVMHKIHQWQIKLRQR